MFIDFVVQRRSTHHYAEEHSAYLEDAVQLSAKELGWASSAAGIETPFHECQIKLSMLAHQLSRIRAAIANRDPHSLVAAKEAIRQIRESLEQTNS
jgi:hypothetical protein